MVLAARFFDVPAIEQIAGETDPARCLHGHQIDSSAVTSLVAELKTMKGTHADLVGACRSTELELQGLDGAISVARAELSRIELEIARSGGPYPTEPLPEEIEVSRLERHRRISAARVDLAKKEIEASRSKITAAIRLLNQAWIDFGSAQHGAIVQRFTEAIQQAALIYADLNSIWHLFQALRGQNPIPAPGYFIVEDVRTTGALLAHHDQLRMVPQDADGGPLWSELRGLLGEVRAVSDKV